MRSATFAQGTFCPTATSFELVHPAKMTINERTAIEPLLEPDEVVLGVNRLISHRIFWWMSLAIAAGIIATVVSQITTGDRIGVEWITGAGAAAGTQA